MLHVTGIKVKSQGGCEVAGRTGHRYSLSTSGAGLGEAYELCVDDATGGLLSGTAQVNNRTGSGPTSLGEDFHVTQVGGVPAFSAP